MASPNKAIDKQSLKGLSPLGKLTPDKIDDIISKSRVENLPAGRIVFRQGEDDGQTIYLLSGQIELSTSGKTRKKLIKGKSVEAKFPLADEVPRPVTAKTKTASSLLYIDSSLLEILLDENPSGEYEVTEINVADHTTGWMMRFLQSRAFLKLPTQNIQKVLMSMEEIHAGKGETIIRQGDDGDYYYILKDGSCAVSRHPAEKSEEVRLAKLTEGEGFGEEALITRCKRNASVTMLENGTLMRLKKDDFLSLLVTPLIRKVHLNSLKSSLYSNSIILDIRTTNEFKKGSLDKAKHIPLSMMRIRIPTLDVKKQYLVYAENKDDANAAAFMLAQHGIDCLVILGTLQHSLPINQPQEKTQKQAAKQPAINDSEAVLTDTEPQQGQAVELSEGDNSPPNEVAPVVILADAVKQKADHTDQLEEKIRQESEQLRLQAKRDAAQMLAEAEAIRQSAIQDAARLRDKIEKEETLKLRSALEDTRSRAESAIKKSEQLAEQIRLEAEQESSQIRQQALIEAEQLRKELEQLRKHETQMKLQLESELLNIRQQAAEQARLAAEQEAEEARVAAVQAAEQARMLVLREAEQARTAAEQQAEQVRLAAEQAKAAALREAEQARADAEQLAEQAWLAAEQARTTALREAEQTRVAAEQLAEQARLAAEQARTAALREAEQTRAAAEQLTEQARLAAEQARSQALREAEETRTAAEQAAALARAEADRLTAEAQAIEKAADQARQNAQKEAEAIRRAALEEAESIKKNAVQDSERIKQTKEAASKSFISHENVFDIDDELTPTVQPVLPYADEASIALKMAKEIKARLIEVEEQRVFNEQKTASRPKQKQAEIRRLDGKIILESEEDIFIFKEPKHADPDITAIEHAVNRLKPDISNTGIGDVNQAGPINELPSADSDPVIADSFEFTVNQGYGDDTGVVKNKKSLLTIAASIFLILALSLAAYTTKIQINFTEVGALVNQDSLESEKQKIKDQARQDFRKKITSINRN